jgi:hypothetical protein
VKRQLSDFIGSPVTDAQADTMIQAARANLAGALGTVLDDDADLARIYARHGQPPPALAAAAAGGQVQAVCDRLGMLEAALATAAEQGSASMFGIAYLKAVRRILFELRTGLLNRRLAEEEALRLLSSARHNLLEAVRILHPQQGPAMTEAVRARMSELHGLASDGTGQLEAMHHEVMRLFDHSGDTALIPADR